MCAYESTTNDDINLWDPMADDYNSLCFNSYSSGPGTLLPLHSSYLYNQCKSVRKEQSVKLVITKIPWDLTENGLRNYIKKVGCKYRDLKFLSVEGSKTIAFVAFSSYGKACEALQLLNNKPPYFFGVKFALFESAFQKKEKLITDEIVSMDIDKDYRFNDEDASHSVIKNISNNGFTPNSSKSRQFSGSDTSSGSGELELLASTDKLFKVLPNYSSNCSYCVASPNLEHLHFIVDEKKIVDPSVKLPDLIDLIQYSCENCGSRGPQLKRCGNCKMAYYCSVKCQLLCWDEHSNVCAESNDNTRNPQYNQKRQLIKENVPKQSTPIVPNVNGIDSIDSSKNFSINALKGSESFEYGKSMNKNNSILKGADFRPPRTDPLAFCNDSGIVPKPSKSLPKEPIPEPKSLVSPLIISQSYHEENAKPMPKTLDKDTLPLNEWEMVMFAFGRDPYDFHVIKLSHKMKISALSKFLDDAYEKSPSDIIPNELTVDSFCVAQYDDDDSWYRAQVIGKGNDHFILKFIDYGNIEKVNIKRIRKMSSNFYQIPQLAIHCKISGIVPNNGNTWDDEASRHFSQIIDQYLDGNFTVQFKGDISKGLHTVELVNERTKESVADMMVKEKMAKYEKQTDALPKINIPIAQLNGDALPSVVAEKNSPKLPQIVSPRDVSQQNTPKLLKNDIQRVVPQQNTPQLPQNDIESNNGSGAELISISKTIPIKAITVTSVINLLNPKCKQNEGLFSDGNPHDVDKCQYWVIFESKQFEELHIDLQNEYKNSLPPKCKAINGQFVTVKASDDAFYRSYIYDVLPDNSAKVLMIDSGYIEQITEDKIYPILSQFSSIPAFAALASPDDPKENDNFNTVYSKNTDMFYFNADIISKFDGETVVEMNITTVNLKIKMKCLSFERVVSEILAPPSPSPPESAKTFDDIIKDLPRHEISGHVKSALVVYQESDAPEVFYICADQDEMGTILTESNALGLNYNGNYIEPRIGITYLVRANDGEWYRGMVLSNKIDGKYEVLMIDFGNIESVPEVYILELPKKLKPSVKPALAVKCAVKKSVIKPEDIPDKIKGAIDGAHNINIEVLDRNGYMYDVSLL